MPPDRPPRRRLRIYAYLATHMITSVRKVVSLYAETHYNKTPYHTSALTGAQWLEELRNGHDDRIKTELGVSKDVFTNLIEVLRDLGSSDSRFVSLEEQVAIFLYMCVTGMSVRHVGERFQRANDTVAK